MKKQTLPTTLFFLLVLFSIPLFWMSLNTPFALIDDYTDWEFIQIFSGFHTFVDWICFNFFRFGGGRFRPFFEFQNAVNWSVFGETPAMHHLMRWVYKIFSLFLVWKMFSMVAPKENGKISFRFLIFLFIFLFFPIQPEARLGPQEVHSVFFLALLNFTLMSSPKLEPKGSALFFTALLGLLFSKEINFSLAAAVFVFCWVNRGVSKKVLIGSGLILVYTFFRLVTAYRGGGYGAEPMGFSQIISNYVWTLKRLFLFNPMGLTFLAVSILGLGLYFSAIKFRSALRWTPSSKLMLLLILEAVFYFAALGSSNHQAVRYLYPLVFLWAQILALATFHIAMTPQWKTAIAVFCIYFLGTHLFHVTYQYDLQKRIRENEKRLLTDTRLLLETGKKIYIFGDGEDEDKIRKYFLKFLPHFEKPSYATSQIVSTSNQADFVISKAETNSSEKDGRIFRVETPPRYLGITENISRLFQGRGPTETLPTWKDGGVLVFDWIINDARDRKKNW